MSISCSDYQLSLLVFRRLNFQLVKTERIEGYLIEQVASICTSCHSIQSLSGNGIVHKLI